MMRILKITAFILTVIGAINWGLIGILKFDLVAAIFGNMSYVTRFVYALVGLSGIFSLLTIYGTLIDDV